jgi:hypothetical protein
MGKFLTAGTSFNLQTRKRRNEMAKKGLLILVVTIFSAAVSACAILGAGIVSGGGDYVSAPEISYKGNLSEQQFQQGAARINTDKESVLISTLPQKVTQAMYNALERFQLKVNDCFLFFCDYGNTTQTSFAVFLRITAINSDGTYRYVFYAWQHI